MNSNELRIGNWVLLNNKHKKVLWFKYDKVCVMSEYPSTIVDLDRLSPIQLTEEILLKCDCYWVRYIENVDGKFFFQYFDLEIELPYLHTFQNLIYTLTNQELNIEL